MPGNSPNILYLTKRYYTGKDLISDQYGRHWEVPRYLLKSGYTINGFTFSYRVRNSGQLYSEKSGHSTLSWTSINLGYLVIPGIIRYLFAMFRHSFWNKPDIVLASSDAFHIILGYIVSRILGRPYVADLYDNYESFWPTRIIGIHWLYRFSIRRAELVVCVSEPLAKYITGLRGRDSGIAIIENGVDTIHFKSLDKHSCRNQLKLPNDAYIVGTAGSLYPNRGINTLFDAFIHLEKKGKKLVLALAGPLGSGISIPESSNIIYLGILPYDQVSEFLNALDLAVICNTENEFGKYCYPQKLTEILATKTPFVSANIGSIGALASSTCADNLYEPNNFMDLAHKIEKNMPLPRQCDLPFHEWKDVAEKFNQELRKLLGT